MPWHLYGFLYQRVTATLQVQNLICPPLSSCLHSATSHCSTFHMHITKSLREWVFRNNSLNYALYSVIKESLCTWWLYRNLQVHRDFLITLLFGPRSANVFSTCHCQISRENALLFAKMGTPVWHRFMVTSSQFKWRFIARGIWDKCWDHFYNFMINYIYNLCYKIKLNYLAKNAVAQWLRCCVTNLKVAGSIPDGVIGIFHWHNPSDRTMSL